MIASPTLQAVVDALEQFDRVDLEEVAFEYLRSHAQVCRLAAGAEHAEENHASDADLAQRVGELSVRRLAELLGPTAWLSIVAHEQRPG
jgi:hypothetical protein